MVAGVLVCFRTALSEHHLRGWLAAVLASKVLNLSLVGLSQQHRYAARLLSHRDA